MAQPKSACSKLIAMDHAATRPTLSFAEMIPNCPAVLNDLLELCFQVGNHGQDFLVCNKSNLFFFHSDDFFLWKDWVKRSNMEIIQSFSESIFFVIEDGGRCILFPLYTCV